MEQTNETLNKEVALMIKGSEFLVITTRPEYETIAGQIQLAAGFKKKIEAYWEPKIGTAYQAHKLLTVERANMVNPLDKFIVDAKRASDAWLDEQERIQTEAARKVREAAEKVAREQAEAAAKMARDAEAAKAAAKAQGDLEAGVKARQAAQEAQQHAQAAQEAQEAIRMVPVAAPQVETGDGMTRVEVWKWEIQDKTAVPEEYKILDEKKITTVVKAMKNSARIPGLRVFMVKEVRRTGRV